MTKFYRVECFREIGGFVPHVMWDGIDCHRCRMLGWTAQSFDEPEPRYVDPEFRACLRHFQRESLLLGKRRAIDRWHRRNERRARELVA
jgi:hypothetical protein